MDHKETPTPLNGPVRRPKKELTPEEIAERENAVKLLREIEQGRGNFLCLKK